MKHTVKITLIILAMFLVAQFIGLVIIDSYDNYFGRKAEKAVEEGRLVKPEVSIVHSTVPPEVKLKNSVDVVKILTSIAIAIVIATALFFLLSRIRITILLRIWFALVVFICLSLAFSLALYPIVGKILFNFLSKNVTLAEFIALPFAAVLTFYKIVKRNIIVHNFTELFIYAGFAVIFLPLFAYSKFGILTASLLLVLISIYDMIAVWKTKHMVEMAKFQIKHMKIFTGFFLPYIKPKDRIKIQKMKIAMQKKKSKKGKRQGLKIRVELAILGGGDVAFSLIFAGTILLAKGLFASIITVLCTTLALALLLLFAKRKPYPAMPFLSAGCFLGLALVLLFF